MRRATTPLLALALAATATGAARAQVEASRFHFENAPTSSEIGSAALSDLPTLALAFDVDNDGDRDLVRVHAGRLEIGRNDAGVFAPYWSFDPSTGPDTHYTVSDAALGDFDGDGFTDIALAGAGPSVVTQILRNDQAGSFVPQAITLLPWLFEDPRMAVADLDHDGFPERAFHLLTTLHYPATLVVLPGDGTGATTYPLPAPAQEVRFGDMDADGDTDVVLRLEASLEVRLNDGTGKLASPSDSAALLQNAGGLVLADFDEDGTLDVLTSEGAESAGGPNYTDLLVFPGDGEGALGVPIRSRFADARWTLNGVGLGRLDADATADLALGLTRGFDVVATLRGVTGGRFEPWSATEIAASGIVLDDLTGSGQPRVLTAAGGVVPVDGAGRVGATQVGAGFDGYAVVLLDLADYDGDGLADVITHDSASSELRVFRSDGERGFTPALDLPLGGAGAFLFLDAVALDGDGRPDIALIAAPFEGARVVGVRNLGGTDASAPIVSPLPACAGATRGVWGRAWGDLDGDGVDELLATARHSTAGVYAHGQGDGTFAAQCFAFPDYARELGLADLDADGDLDLVHVGLTNAGLWLLSGRGDGTFRAGRNETFGTRLGERLALGDVDADGDVDVITTREAGGLALLRNDGSGDEALAQSLTTGGAYSDLRLADLDEDGLPEIVARGTSVVDLYANDGGTLAAAPPALEVGSDPNSAQYPTVEVADLDGDRLPDICVGGAFQRPVSNPTVYFDRTQLSADGVASAGRTVAFALREPRAAGRPYLLLASRFGTQPGVRFGAERLPLNLDPALWPAIRGDASTFGSFAGRFDGSGRARATLALPPTLALPGPLPVDFAFLAFDAAHPRVLRTSNELGLTLR